MPGIDLRNRSAVSGLYAITPDMADTGQLYDAVHQALAGGVNWLQYRNKAADSRLRRVQAAEIHLLCKHFQVPLIVNDHLDLAMEIDAEGLHVGGDDISPVMARCYFGRDKIIGISCYNQLNRAIEAEEAGADYVAFGAFYPSMTKTGTYQAPIELLTAAKKKLGIPVVAIGGIDLDNAGMLIASGCDAVAVSQALFGAQDIQSAARYFSELFD
ncbi:MAG TPA: thiamine phosphate synthase [Nitrosomonas europaea]|uniref:thiamine phosphate synthase n=1 Tax=Nitrosomonas europaea TaxID=915 RepID=UPI002492F8A2|nr:thiamine phosphate synthase [Nitrosomonas europaea]HRN81233.1 thiamine phosphate synthase [Nitrosomonas europaea]HRO56039.1 thiamine phosphate synthase [Nitrosomonas europaea]HRQ07652.1 thiamine phosphate synthase [Nitrosomonas europaea]HUM73663.1 thiamine phosphate synthase [Nitrosomonas europaea]